MVGIIRVLVISGLLTVLFIITSCGLDVENPTPPDTPHWVQKSLPEEWPEHGIDACEGGGIYLEWEKLTEPDIEEIRIYRAERDAQEDDSIVDNFKRIRIIEAGSESFFYDQSAQSNHGYFYYLEAVNNSGSPSMPSDTLFYYLMQSVEYSTMNPVNTTDTLKAPYRLNWIYPVEVAMEQYVLTLLDNTDQLLLRRTLTPTSYTSNMEYFYIPSDIILTLDNGNIYKWRIDCCARFHDGYEQYGSESKWAFFTYREDE